MYRYIYIASSLYKSLSTIVKDVQRMVYHVSLNAVEDLERNKGTDEQPYFMSKKLMKLLNVKNKLSTDQPDSAALQMESLEDVTDKN